MPMAGEGSRFKNAGYDMPKPLIKFNEKYLFEKSLETIEGLNYTTLTFVVRKEHIDKYGLDLVILNEYPDANIISVEQTTRGAAETAFIAVKYLINTNQADFTDSMLIMDCDVMVNCEEWKAIITRPKFDGVLLSFKSTDPRYSYADIKHGEVVKTAEKDPISDNALTSPYFIKKIENFVDAFHDMERFQEPDGSPTYKEMYVSVLYNFMIANGGHVVLVTTDNITPLGTPEELENALKND